MSVLSSKLADSQLFVLNSTELASHRTALLSSALSNWNMKNFFLIHANDELGVNMALAGRGLKNVDFMPSRGANAYDIMRHHALVISQQGVQELTNRLLTPQNYHRHIKTAVDNPAQFFKPDTLQQPNLFDMEFDENAEDELEDEDEDYEEDEMDEEEDGDGDHNDEDPTPHRRRRSIVVGPSPGDSGLYGLKPLDHADLPPDRKQLFNKFSKKAQGI